MASGAATIVEEYTLHYWPTIPGRGEFVRLCFEASKTRFVDQTDVKTMQALIMEDPQQDGKGGHHLCNFAPPILEITIKADSSSTATPAEGEGESGNKRQKMDSSTYYISQTPAILSYLAPKLGLLGDAARLEGVERDIAQAQILQLCLTSLDLCNEVHDTHHPIATMKYYEEQKEEAFKKAEDVRQNRIPKFLKLFEMKLNNNKQNKDDDTVRLYGTETTVADLTLFQVMDGLQFAFPKYMKSLNDKGGEYRHVFSHHKQLQHELAHYLQSDRRRPYSNGVFRYYPELDQEV